MNRARAPRRQRGFLIIAAVFLLVVLAGLVAYLMTVSTTSQAASAADFNSARAYQAARAGAEWAAFKLLQVPGDAFTTACNGGTSTSNRTFPSTVTLTGYTSTVTCTSVSLTEGAGVVKGYRIVSNGCNQPSGTSCPNTATTSATYAERQVTLMVTSN
jgi:MSHA biogenesis protein MshP